MKVKLKVTSGKLTGKTIDLPKGTFLVGRGQECDLRARSDIVSRHHCEIIVDDTSIVIRDLESRNGTFVNDDRIVERQELTLGDTIQIGPMQFEVLITAQPKRAVAAPEVAAPKIAAAVKPKVEPEEKADAELANFAPPAASESEDDISQWLDGDLDAAPVKDAGLQDTDVPGLDDTRQVDPDGARTIDDASSDPTTKERQDKTKPGKLPPTHTEPSKDSGEAAANVLKQFSRRK